MYHSSGTYVTEIAHVFPKPLIKHTLKYQQESVIQAQEKP